MCTKVIKNNSVIFALMIKRECIILQYMGHEEDGQNIEHFGLPTYLGLYIFKLSCYIMLCLHKILGS